MEMKIKILLNINYSLKKNYYWYNITIKLLLLKLFNLIKKIFQILFIYLNSHL